MGITFNGDVTINGNVEMYDNGSMKINTFPYAVPIADLKQFIEKHVPYSQNKDDYLDAANVLSQSEDQTEIQKAIQKIRSLGSEVGRAVLVSGLSHAVLEAMRNLG